MTRQTTIITVGILALTTIASMPCLGVEIEVSFPSKVESEAIDGRVILMLSTNDEDEPRFQVRPGVNAIQIFGVDVDAMGPGETRPYRCLGLRLSL